MATKYVSPYTLASLDNLKTPLLYFDKVAIRNRALIEVKDTSGRPRGSYPGGTSTGVVAEVHQLVDEQYRAATQLLEDEGLLEYEESPSADEDSAAIGQLRKLLNENQSLLLERSDEQYDANGRLLTYSVKFIEDQDLLAIHERFIGPIKAGAPIDLGVMLTYYEGLLCDAMQALRSGNSVVSSSTAIFRLMQLLSSKNIIPPKVAEELVRNSIEPMLACRLIDEAVVDVSALTFEDILEARQKMPVEFSAFREEIDSIVFDMVSKHEPEKLIREGARLARERIRPRLRDIERKIEDQRYGLMKGLFGVLRKPDPYVPLIGSAYAGLPIELAVLVSLGIVTAEALADSWRQKKQLTQDGLFFLVKQKEVAAQSIQSKQPPHSRPQRLSKNQLDKTYFLWPNALTPTEPQKPKRKRD